MVEVAGVEPASEIVWLAVTQACVYGTNIFAFVLARRSRIVSVCEITQSQHGHAIPSFTPIHPAGISDRDGGRVAF